MVKKEYRIEGTENSSQAVHVNTFTKVGSVLTPKRPQQLSPRERRKAKKEVKAELRRKYGG